MNIIEAFKSRKNIRRSNTGFGFHHPCSRHYPPEDILAEDWEVEPERTAPKMMTMDQVLAITTKVLTEMDQVLAITPKILTEDDLLRIVNERIKAEWEKT